MPYYDYICDKCGTKFDVFFSISQERTGVKCDKCGSAKVRRDFGSVTTAKKSSGGGAASGGGSSCSSCSSKNCSSCK